MEQKSKIYFASDFHLGIDTDYSSQQRERLIVNWLDGISKEASEIFLLGDIFDYWFEYRHVVPKGYVRLLARMAEMSDHGVKLHFFKGNHDMWLKNYFQEELGVIVHHGPEVIRLQDKLFFIAHGDGLGRGDRMYKLTKFILQNRVSQFLFGLLHPGLGLPLMKYCSRQSRVHQEEYDPENISADPQVNFCEQYSREHPEIDYYIMGHRHHAFVHALSNQKSIYVNTGDWTSKFTYAILDGGKVYLKEFKE